jgi:hypothetical protein
MTRAMRDAAIPDRVIAAELDLLDTSLDNARQRLDYAEGLFTREARDSKSRAKQAFALRRLEAASRQALASGRCDPRANPLLDPAIAEATIDYLRAIANVLAAEPDAAPRDYLPAHIRQDSDAAIEEIEGTIERIRGDLAEHERREAGARKREAERRLGGLDTRDYAELSEAERERIEQDLGLGTGRDRAAASDALARSPIPLE